MSKSGYKPLGIIGMRISGDTGLANLNVYNWYIDDSDVLHFAARLLTESSVTSATEAFYWTVLYVKG